MTDLRTAAQQALEAMSSFENGTGGLYEGEFSAEIAALRAALAEPVLNPAPGYCKHCKQYTIEEPLPAEPVQEPVAWIGYINGVANDLAFEPFDLDSDVKKPLFTAPPQRKPLTEEEIDSIWDSEKAFADIYAIVRAIERAHGIV